MPDITNLEDAFFAMERAISEGDLERVRRIVDSGANPAIDDYSNLALHEAVDCGNEAIAKYLIDVGADPNRVHPVLETATPLSIAIENRDLSIAQVLMRNGAILEDTIIEYLFTYGKCVNRISFATALGIDLNQTFGKYQRTPVHLVTINNDLASLRALKDAGADMNAEDLNGDRALDFAIRNNYIELIEFLST